MQGDLLLKPLAAVPEHRRAKGRPKSGDLAALEARLIRVAREHFIRDGYGGASMNKIAYAARVSKGTLYARFPTKAALFRAILDSQMKLTETVHRPLRARPETLDAMLRHFGERGLRFTAAPEVIELNRLIYAESSRFPEFADAVKRRAEASIAQLSQEIRKFAVIEDIPCRDADAAAELIFTLLRGYYAEIMQNIRTPGTREIKGWIRGAVGMLLAGRRHW